MRHMEAVLTPASASSSSSSSSEGGGQQQQQGLGAFGLEAKDTDDVRRYVSSSA